MLAKLCVVVFCQKLNDGRSGDGITLTTLDLLHGTRSFILAHTIFSFVILLYIPEIQISAYDWKGKWSISSSLSALQLIAHCVHFLFQFHKCEKIWYYVNAVIVTKRVEGCKPRKKTTLTRILQPKSQLLEMMENKLILDKIPNLRLPLSAMDLCQNSLALLFGWWREFRGAYRILRFSGW